MRQMLRSFLGRSQSRSRQPWVSMKRTSQATAISRAMERTRVSLSGSKTRSEWMLKKRGAPMTAASQPASMKPLHHFDSFDSMRALSPIGG